MDKCQECRSPIERAASGRPKKFCGDCLRAHKRAQHQRRIASLTPEERRARVQRDHAGMRRCCVDGCERSGPYKGALCNMHKRRLDRYGSLNPVVSYTCLGCGGGFEVARRKGSPPTRCPECVIAYDREFRLMKLYGLTKAEYDAMFIVQGEACAICRTPIPGKRGWHVDHDHRTGAVRGILCGACNAGLGHFHDSTAAMAAAIEYLKSVPRPTMTITIAGL